jgi:hypothetical protein
VKLSIIILLFSSPIICYCQYQPGFLTELFFGRQPNARSEAMGKAYTAIDGDLGSVYFNPAGVATIKKMEITTSYTPPGIYLTKGYYTFYGVGYRVNKYLQLALSQFHSDYGKTQVINATKTPYSEKNTLTVSSEPIKNLLVALNTNYFVWQPGIDKTSTAIYFDFGLIKKIPIALKKRNRHSINLAASISNFNYASTNATFNGITNKYYLPVINRYGISYELKYGKYFFIDTVNIFKVLLQSEYQMLLNSKYRLGIKFGGEIMFLNILSLRAGWYKEKVYNFGLPDDNNSEIKDFTYGVGLQLPLYSLLKIPVNLNFDYTSLPQVSYLKTRNDWPNFKTYSLRLNIFLKNKGR